MVRSTPTHIFFLFGQNITLYLMDGFNRNPDQMKKLGKHTTGKVCLYIKRLSDVDTEVLKSLIIESAQAK